ncbi:hypothetical protein MTO96_025679 [Rhipicephalus appendiculatus]
MKKCARSYMWCPGIDKDIETLAAECTACQSNQRAPPRAPVPYWDRASTAWHTVHLDLAGPIDGSTFLVIVDAYSKWVEVRHMNKTTSAAVIDALRSSATFGLPHKVVSDNGSAFVSAEIQKLLQRQLHHKAQHTTVQNTTGQTPAQLMFSRELRTHISVVLPEPPSKGRRDNEDAPRCRKLHKGQPVLARQFHQKPEWVPAIVKKRIGLRSWLVEVKGTVPRRRLNQLRHLNGHYPPGGHSLGSNPPKSFNTAWLLTKAT